MSMTDFFITFSTTSVIPAKAGIQKVPPIFRESFYVYD